MTNGNTDNAMILDGRTGRIRVTTPTGKKPDAVAYDPATRTLWVMNAGDGSVTVIDPASGKALATVAVGGSLELGATDGHGKLYVNVEDRNDVAVIDTRARRLVAREPLPGCDGPTGIIYDPATRETVSACANGIAVVLSDRGVKLAALPIGKRPDGAAFDARRHVVLDSLWSRRHAFGDRTVARAARRRDRGNREECSHDRPRSVDWPSLSARRGLAARSGIPSCRSPSPARSGILVVAPSR